MEAKAQVPTAKIALAFLAPADTERETGQQGLMDRPIATRTLIGLQAQF
jgi:hypothetical protein